MNKTKTTALYDGENYDQSAWVYEKTSNILSNVCKIYNKIEDDDFKDSIDSALKDALKLYAFWSGDKSLYCDDVLYFLRTYGENGFEHLQYITGKSNKKDKITLAFADNNTILRIFNYITKENNRTNIEVELARLAEKNPWSKTIAIDIDKVTMGEKPWDWFYEKHKDDDINDILVNVQTLVLEN